MTPEQYKEMRELIVQMREKADQRDAEIKKYGEASVETNAHITKLNDRIDELETKANRPAIITPEQSRGSIITGPEVKAFQGYMRRGEKSLTPDELKALSSGSDPDGGYLMPNQTANTIIEKLIEVSPVRELAEVMTLSLGDTIDMPAEDDQEFECGWVSEIGARPETNAGQIRSVGITAHEMYAKPKVTQKLLDDSAFNIEQWLSRRVTRGLAKKEGAAFVSGDGVGKPEGLLTSTKVVPFANGHASELQADGIILMTYDLPEFYANTATFMLKRATLGTVRTLKDGQGNYLWQVGLTATQPATILGRPYREAVDMPAVAVNSYPILFGDFRAAYTVVDRQGIRVLRDPYSAKPYVEFYTTRRVGGKVTLGEAMRKLKIAATV